MPSRPLRQPPLSLTTFCFVCPARACSAKRQAWTETYESMHECVVPRSTKELYKDETGILFSVTLFKRPEAAVKEFSGACSLLRFVMREYSYDSDAMKSREKNLVEAKADVMKKYVRAAGPSLVASSLVRVPARSLHHLSGGLARPPGFGIDVALRFPIDRPRNTPAMSAPR